MRLQSYKPLHALYLLALGVTLCKVTLKLHKVTKSFVGENFVAHALSIAIATFSELNNSKNSPYVDVLLTNHIATA